MQRLFGFIRHLYSVQNSKFYVAIFMIVLISVRLIQEGIDTGTFLGVVLGVAFLIVMGRQKIVRAAIILVVFPCVLLAIITGYQPPVNIQSSILGFVTGGFVVLLYREYVNYLNITKNSH